MPYKKINIDESRLPAVMEMIEKAASLMEEEARGGSQEAKRELEQLQKELREVSGNRKLKIENFQRYWGYTDLETAARKALVSPPPKRPLTNEQLREIVLHILERDEAEMDRWLTYLEINTGLSRGDASLPVRLQNFLLFPVDKRPVLAYTFPNKGIIFVYACHKLP